MSPRDVTARMYCDIELALFRGEIVLSFSLVWET
jgi:hypothetical protein